MPIQDPKAQINPATYTSMAGICNIIFYIALFCVEGAIIGLYALISYEDGTGFTTSGFGTYDTFTQPLIQFEAPVPLRVAGLQNIMNVNWLQIDMSIFMLIGFGFLIVFLRFHRWMSLGLTYFACALSIQLVLLWSVLFVCVFRWNYQGIYEFANPYILTNDFANFSYLLTYGIRGAVAILITLGALMGKIDAFQTLIIVVLETIIYTANEMICNRIVNCRDVGGCFYIHAFGSIAGVVASRIYSPKANCKDNPNINGSYFSSTIAFIGTFFLWVSFPMFNSFNPTLDYKMPWSSDILVMQNTFFALTASTISAMWLSVIIYSGKFNWEGVCFATLAGGIIISGSADMFAYPFPPLIVGSCGGLISMASYAFIKPFLERLYYFDTRGVLELHYIPSIFGMVVAASQATFLDRESYFSLWWHENSITNIRNNYLHNTDGFYLGGMEVCAFLISSGLGIGTGFLLGGTLRAWRIFNLPEDTFGDHIWWKMVQDETNLNDRNMVPDQSKISMIDQRISPRRLSPRPVVQAPLSLNMPAGSAIQQVY